MKHEELVIKFKTGIYEWLDPVGEVYITGPVGAVGDILTAYIGSYMYSYYMDDIADWVVREYDGENYYPFGDFDIERKGHMKAIENEYKNG